MLNSNYINLIISHILNLLLILLANKRNIRKGTCGKHSVKLSYSICSKVSITERLKFTESSL